MFYGMVSFISVVIDSMSHFRNVPLCCVTGFLLASMCASGFVYVYEYISARCRMTETSSRGKLHLN